MLVSFDMSIHISATGIHDLGRLNQSCVLWKCSCIISSVAFQISSLVTLQLLSQVSHNDQLDAPKYKCAVSLDFICAISKWVCLCMLVFVYHTCLKRTELFKGTDLFQYFTENMLGVFYFPGQWTLILWSICTTSCEPSVREGGITRGDSKIKMDFFPQECT